LQAATRRGVLRFSHGGIIPLAGLGEHKGSLMNNLDKSIPNTPQRLPRLFINEPQDINTRINS